MLTEFGWSKEDSDKYQNGESLDIKCGVTGDGRIEIQNHDNPTESQVFDTPEEAASALASVLSDKRRSLS